MQSSSSSSSSSKKPCYLAPASKVIEELHDCQCHLQNDGSIEDEDEDEYEWSVPVTRASGLSLDLAVQG